MNKKLKDTTNEKHQWYVFYYEIWNFSQTQKAAYILDVFVGFFFNLFTIHRQASRNVTP